MVFNNGKLEYLTGTHYLYCAWWKIDVGLPYLLIQIGIFYLWRYVEMIQELEVLYLLTEGGVVRHSVLIRTFLQWMDGKKDGRYKGGDMVLGRWQATCVKYVSPIAF